LSVFVDSSVWFAAAVVRDHDNVRARSILQSAPELVTTDHVLIETWLLLNSRYRRDVADLFWGQIRRGGVRIEHVTAGDLEAAWAISAVFHDQSFSIVDRTSFAVMERLGIVQVASFDSDFSIYRYGRARDKAFEVIQMGHSDTFRLFHQAILGMRQVAFTYRGFYREVCPYILGHKDGAEKVLAFQFGGTSTRGLPAKGQWRCFEVVAVKNPSTRDGPWFGASAHRKTQRCVDDVYIDVNTAVPNQPGRR
jgi:predicted nucleic acid-binding protein